MTRNSIARSPGKKELWSNAEDSLSNSCAKILRVLEGWGCQHQYLSWHFPKLLLLLLPEKLGKWHGGVHLFKFGRGVISNVLPRRDCQVWAQEHETHKDLSRSNPRDMAAAGRSFSIIHEKILHCRFVVMCPTMDLVASLHADGQLSVHRWGVQTPTAAV